MTRIRKKFGAPFWPVLAALFIIAFADHSFADTRKLVSQSDWPWQAIGRVNIENSGYCTGTLVGPKTVLTAAHCLLDQRTKGPAHMTRLHFVAGYQRGEFLAHATVIGVETPAIRTAESDWALLTLDRDISPIVTPIPVVPLNADNWRMMKQAKAGFVQAGYRKKQAHALSVNHNCKLTKFDPVKNLLFHKCRVMSGDSGGPIMAYVNGSYAVIAVHTARTNAKSAGFGVAITGAAYSDLIRFEKFKPLN